MLLLIDNFDSFVHNLGRYFQRLGQETLVVRNNEIDVDGVAELKPSAIVISPGPCGPAQAGCSVAVVQRFYSSLPILGVCLGHQVIAESLGGRLRRANYPMHGRTSEIQHDQKGVFRRLTNPLQVCRYHSLVIDPDDLPACLAVSASTEDGTIMAVRHREYPVIGLQFHPEAILTNSGYQILANFLTLAGLGVPNTIPSPLEEMC